MLFLNYPVKRHFNKYCMLYIALNNRYYPLGNWIFTGLLEPWMWGRCTCWVEPCSMWTSAGTPNAVQGLGRDLSEVMILTKSNLSSFALQFAKEIQLYPGQLVLRNNFALSYSLHKVTVGLAPKFSGRFRVVKAWSDQSTCLRLCLASLCGNGTLKTWRFLLLINSD
jgi:hypothetical protein